MRPGQGSRHLPCGGALDEQGQVEGGIRHYRMALEINPKMALAHINLGSVMDKTGRLDEAIFHWKKAVYLDPDDAQPRYNLGHSLLAAGRPDEALGHLDHAVRINPKYAKAHGVRGEALLALGRLAHRHEAPLQRLALLPPHHPELPLATLQLQLCEHALVLKSRLPAILSGKEKPANAGESLEFGWLCLPTKQYASAVRL